MSNFYLPNEILNLIFSYMPTSECTKLLKHPIYIYNKSIEWNTKNNTSKVCQIYFSEPFYKYILKQNKETIYYARREKRKQEKYKELNLLKSSINFEILSSRINFGKHKGTFFSNLPTDYVNWMLRNNVIKNEIQIKALKDLRQYRELTNEISFLSRDPYN